MPAAVAADEPRDGEELRVQEDSAVRSPGGRSQENSAVRSPGGRSSSSSSQASHRSPSLESLPHAPPAAAAAAASVPGGTSAQETSALAGALSEGAVASSAAPEALAALRSVGHAVQSRRQEQASASAAGTAELPASMSLPPGSLEANASGGFAGQTAATSNDSRPLPKGSDICALHRWAEADLPKVQERSDERLRVFCAVWNLHGKHAPADLSPWLTTSQRHHIYVVGTCECERSIEMSMLWSNKANWERQVQNHLGEEFKMIGASNMSAIHVMVFVHQYLWKYCWDVKTGQVPTGFANFIGNKGGTQVAFGLGNTSLLFVNAHLAAHANQMKERTQSLSRILADSPIRHMKAGSGVHEEYDRVFFMGDLNARLNAKRDEVDSWLAERQLQKCLECDQLLPLLKASTSDPKAGLWPHFDEATINFMPTYKFNSRSDVYDTSKKRRVPSWTDRILWKRDPSIKPMSYGSVPVMQVSDHRPVFAQFEVSVDLSSWSGPPSDYAAKQGGSSVCSIQ